MTANLDPNTQSGNTGRMVSNVIALIVALLGLCVCSLGGLMMISPAIMTNAVSSTGRQLTLGDGFIAGMLCVVPGLLLVVFAVGLHFILGRRR